MASHQALKVAKSKEAHIIAEEAIKPCVGNDYFTILRKKQEKGLNQCRYE